MTFLSSFPEVAAKYALTRFPGSTYHMSPLGTLMTSGNIDSDVYQDRDVWFSYRLQVHDTGTETQVRVKLWSFANDEPREWSIEAADDSPTRFVRGRFGCGSFGSGRKGLG